nr:S1-like domain-containing RNA-binding protein [Numidum massiliense]
MTTTLLAGEIVDLEVARKSDFGYFLTDGTQDVLLHQNEAVRTLEEGETVEVFLYHDHSGRLAATMTIPEVTFTNFAWAKVVGVEPHLGAFINIGIQKDVLLSKDDLPRDRRKWPQVEDNLYCSLKDDRKGRLLIALAEESEFAALMREAPSTALNDWVTGSVYKLIADGAFLFTDQHYIAFLHREEMTGGVRLGEKVTGRIAYVRGDGRVNISQLPRKEHAYADDAQAILDYLIAQRGRMPYGDKSDPADIKRVFHISKAAFKRALGKLLKERKVYQEDGWTYLTKHMAQATFPDKDIDIDEE